MYADYFLTLAKTTADGMTMLLIPKSDGVSVRHMKMSGSSSAGTAFVDLDDVLVPVENVVGEVGQGFKCIVSNFNHEVGRFNFRAESSRKGSNNLISEAIHILSIGTWSTCVLGRRNIVRSANFLKRYAN